MRWWWWWCCCWIVSSWKEKSDTRVLSCKYKLLWSTYTHTHIHKQERFWKFCLLRGASRLLVQGLYSPLCITQFKGFPICSSLMIPTNKKPATSSRSSSRWGEILEFILKTLTGLSLKKKPAIFTNALNEFFFETTHYNLAIQKQAVLTDCVRVLAVMVMMKFVWILPFWPNSILSVCCVM